MYGEFRFMAVCERAFREPDGRETLQGLFNVTRVADLPIRLPLVVAIGAILYPEHSDKRLELMTWRFDANSEGHRQPIGEYVGSALQIPKGAVGPVCLPFHLEIPFENAGIHGFELFDPDRVFGTTEGPIAAYTFSISK